jgi:hypothetical protein
VLRERCRASDTPAASWVRIVRSLLGKPAANLGQSFHNPAPFSSSHFKSAAKVGQSRPNPAVRGLVRCATATVRRALPSHRGCSPLGKPAVACWRDLALPLVPGGARHTSQISIACRSEVSGSRLGTNSWPTKPV